MNIKLYYKYLIHDVDQWTFRLAKVRVEDAMFRDEVSSNEKRSTDLSFYIRKLEDGVAHLRAHLADELTNSKNDNSDTLDTKKTYWSFDFKSDTAITADSSAVAELMHRFVLMHVIRDWALIYAPDSVALATNMLKEAEDALDEGLYSLELPTKHRRPEYSEDNQVIIV